MTPSVLLAAAVWLAIVGVALMGALVWGGR